MTSKESDVSEGVEQRARELVERSVSIFHSYDMGWRNINDQALLRDCIAFIKAATLSPPLPSPGVERDETGWLVETVFGPHTHYLSVTDPRENWNDSRRRSRRFDDEWTASGYKALAGMLRFEKDAGKAVRFARKEDAETFIAAFGRLLIEPKATEHCWPALSALSSLEDRRE